MAPYYLTKKAISATSKRLDNIITKSIQNTGGLEKGDLD